MSRIFIFFILSLFAVSCTRLSPQVQLISAEGVREDIPWTQEELQKEIAVKLLWKTEKASAHKIRLRTKEKSHIHQEHDLVVVLIKGRGKLHYLNHSVKIKPGDIMEIPRGTIHWAENLDSEASEVYAVFIPPYDGKDFKEVAIKEEPLLN